MIQSGISHQSGQEGAKKLSAADEVATAAEELQAQQTAGWARAGLKAATCKQMASCLPRRRAYAAGWRGAECKCKQSQACV